MKKLIVLCTLVFAACTTANAGTVLISGSDTDPSVPLDLSLEVGESGQAFVWYTSEPDTVTVGLALDILSSNPILTATSFDILAPGAGGRFARWDGTNGGELGSSPLVNDSNAAAVTAFGIDTEFPDGVFEGLSFLHGTLNFVADAAGVTQLTPAAGALGIADNAGNALTPAFVSGSVTVGGGGGNDPVIPEPSTAILAALGLAGFVGRRR